MAPLAAFPWVWLLAGLLLGSWIGATIGSAGVLLLAGRRMKQLEAVNQLLRVKLKSYGQKTWMGAPATYRSAAPPFRNTNRGLGPVLRPFRMVAEQAPIPIDGFASRN